MKSLKRTLCLVLALVMVLGLFGVASASKFTDDNTIQYKEAVDVMTGIGAIDGYTDGTFNPKGTIRRAEAAKLVVYTILGKTAAENQLPAGTTSSFSDVTAAYSWAIPSIEYLVKEGVINGRGDGTFDPNGNITGYELGKMLLCAIGYGAKNEYVGAGWDLQVTIDGSRMGPVSYGSADRRLSVFSNRATAAGSLGAPATREEAALYCFNTIQKLKVEYVAALDVYADGTNALGVAQGSIGTNVYPTLTRPGTGDIFGNPGYQWKFGGVELFATTNTPIVSFTSKKTVGDLKKAVVSAGYNWADGTKTVVTGYNPSTGVPITATVPSVSVLVNDTAQNIGTNLTDLTADICGDGLLLRAYADSNRNLSLVTVVDTYVGQVTNITPDSASTADIDERALEVTLLNGTKINASPIDGTVGFDAAYTASKTMIDAGSKMYLIVAPKGTTALSATVPTVAELTVSSITKDADGDVKSFIADGKSYSFADHTPAVVKNTVKANGTYKVLSNEYGYVVLVDLVSANENIGVVVKAGMTPAAFGNVPTLKVVTPKGEKVDLLMSSWEGTATPVGTNIRESDYINRVVKYVPDTGANAGKYKVTNISSAAGKNPVGLTYNADEDDNQVLKIQTGQTDIGGLHVAYANSQTVFVIGGMENGAPVYNVYTGVDNVPSVKATATNDPDTNPVYNYSFVKNPATGADTNIAAVFYVNLGVTQANTKTLSFVAVGEDPITLGDGRTMRRSAIISGKALTDIKEVLIPETLLVSSGIADAQGNIAAAPFISEYKLETEKVLNTDVVSSMTRFNADTSTQAMFGKGTAAPENKIVGLGTVVPGTSVNHTYTDDVTVWIIDPSKSVVTEKFDDGKINDIMTSKTNNVFWLQSVTTGQASAIYVVKSDKIAVGMTIANQTSNAPVVKMDAADNSNWDTGTGPVLKATLVDSTSSTGAAPSGSWTTYTWTYSADGGTTWKPLTGSNSTTATITVDAGNFTKTGTYVVKCVATDSTTGTKYMAATGTLNLAVTVNYKVAQPTAIANSGTGEANAGLAITLPADVSYTTDGKVTITVTVANTVAAAKTLKVAVTGGGSSLTYTATKAEGGGAAADLTNYKNADGATTTASTAATYTFTVGGITAPISEIGITVS